MAEQKLMQDVATRWNSTLYILERLQGQKCAVTQYPVEKDFQNLNTSVRGLSI